MHVYSIDTTTVASILVLSDRSPVRWYKLFRATGNVVNADTKAKLSRWPRDVCALVQMYVKAHPCFYFEELRYELRKRYRDSIGVSDATICRALRFDLKLTREVLTKRARESVPRERQECVGRLTLFYRDPDQLVFVDETSKYGRSVLHRYGWLEIHRRM